MSHKTFSGKFEKIQAKILRTPQNLPAPTLICAGHDYSWKYKVWNPSHAVWQQSDFSWAFS